MLHIGLLGAGRIAAVMAQTIRKMNKNGNHDLCLYAVAARDLQRARDFAGEQDV